MWSLKSGPFFGLIFLVWVSVLQFPTNGLWADDQPSPPVPERVQELEELTRKVWKLAQADFKKNGVFHQEKPAEFDELALAALQAEIPTSILEEVWELSRFYTIQYLQKWFFEHSELTRKKLDDAGISKFLKEAELKLFVFNSQALPLLVKIKHHEYSTYWYLAASRAVALEPETISFHLKMKNILMKKLKVLDQEFPGMLNWNQIHEDLEILKLRAERLFQGWYAEQAPPHIGPLTQIKYGARGLGEWLYYLTAGNWVTYSEAVKGLFNGKGFQNGFKEGGQWINENRKALQEFEGSSVFGSDKDFVYGYSAPFYFRYFLAPLVQTGTVIQNTLELIPEYLHIIPVMKIYGLTREEYETLRKSNAWVKWGPRVAVGSVALGGGLAVVVAGGTSALVAKGLSGGALWLAQAGLTVKPLSVSLGMGSVFSLAQEVYTAGTPNGQFSFKNLMENTAVSAPNTLIFMGAISKLTQVLAMRGVSQTRAMTVASGIDVVEGSADIPQTLIMYYDAKNNVQYLGVALLAFGNIWDTGDSVLAVGSTAYQSGLQYLREQVHAQEPKLLTAAEINAAVKGFNPDDHNLHAAEAAPYISEFPLQPE